MAKIGIDFGTTNTVISYYADNEPIGFHYPAMHPSIYIPSVVCLTASGDPLVGYEAMSEAGDTSNSFYKAMKMYLPLDDAERKEQNWPTRSKGKQYKPEDVIKMFFTKLLKNGEKDSFETREEAIDEIVLCVPHVWNREITHKGREKLKKILESLGMKVARIVSEPIAAAAYFIFRYQEKFKNNFVGNLLVCDFGGGTFDVTLCKIHDTGKVEELLNDGNGLSSLGLGRAGVFFDDALIKKANLRKHQREIMEGGSEYHELYSQLQLKKNTSSTRINAALELTLQEKEADRNSTPIISPINGIGFYFDDIMESFEPVKAGMLEVLERLDAKISERNLKIDALFLTGGFNQFLLCNKTIVDYFTKDKPKTVIDAALDANIAGLSISYGACMIANGIVSIDEKFPHSLGFIAYKHEVDVRKEPQKIHVPLIKGGKQLNNYSKVTLSDDQFLISLDRNGKLNFKFFIDMYDNSADRRELIFSDIELPGSTRMGTKWKIGMRIDLSQIVYVVFAGIDGQKHEIRLLDIMDRLGQGKIYLDDSESVAHG